MAKSSGKSTTKRSRSRKSDNDRFRSPVTAPVGGELKISEIRRAVRKVQSERKSRETAASE